MMSLPRVLLTPQLLGSPFDEQQQIKILKSAVKLLKTAGRNGTVQDYY